MNRETYDKCIADNIQPLCELVRLLCPVCSERYDVIVERIVSLAKERIDEYDDCSANPDLLTWLGQIACMVLFEYC